MSDEIKVPEDKVYSVKRLLAARDKLVAGMTHGVYDRKGACLIEPTASVYLSPYKRVIECLVPVVKHFIPADTLVIESTMLDHLSRAEDGRPSKADIIRCMWSMVANKNEMICGNPIPAFSEVLTAEWVPVWFMDSVYSLRGEIAGSIVTYTIMGGRPAGCKFSKFLTSGSLRFITRAIGLPKYKKVYGEDIVGLEAWVLLDPGLSNQYNSNAEWDTITATSTMKAGNAKLYSARHKPCEFGYEFSCTDCPAGLVTCWRATHSEEYSLGMCRECLIDCAYTSIESRKFNLCVNCFNEQRIKNNRKKGARRCVR